LSQIDWKIVPPACHTQFCPVIENMNFSMVLNGVPSDVSFKSFKNWTSGSLKNLIDHNVPLAMSIIQLFTVIDFPYFNIWEKMKH
jgi:hypothetical protein